MSKSKYILTLSGVLFMVMLLVSGGTFAYWTWQSAASNQTNVIAIVNDNIQMVITPTNATASNLRPTGDCDGSGRHLRGEATVVITNNTKTAFQAQLKLKGKITKTGVTTMPTEVIEHINYAVFLGDVSTCNLANAVRKGTFKGVSATGAWTDLNYIADFDATRNPTSTSDDLKNASPTKNEFFTGLTVTTAEEDADATYTVFVWIDPDYTGTTNTGTTVSDPLQGATISVTWSENSYVEQIHNNY